MSQTFISISFPYSLQKVLNKLNRKGHIYLVGGAVRDHFLGITPKDYDFEVFGYTLNDFILFLNENNIEHKLVGQDFGIFILTINGIDYEFALPRTERKVGINHTDFEVTINPNMDVKEAQSRRDFTCNAIYYSTKNNLIYDYFGGRTDIVKGIINPTSEAFKEDSLRVLRAMRFISKYNLIASDKLIEYCTEISLQEILNLSDERRYNEFLNWAKTSYPSKGIQFLKQCNKLGIFKYLNDLEKVPQNKKWHPEGNVWIHTIQVLQALENDGNTGDPILTIATLLHDIGKIKTTDVNQSGTYIPCYEPKDTDKITSYNHDVIGSEMVEDFFSNLNKNYEKDIVQKVAELVYYHMQVTETNKALNKLMNKLQYVSIQQLLKLQLADCWRFDRNIIVGNFLKLKQIPVFIPIITGKFLINEGYKHEIDFHFGEIIKQAKEDQLEGILTEQNKMEWIKEFQNKNSNVNFDLDFEKIN